MADFKNEEDKIKYNKFKVLFSVNPFDIFGIYNKKGLDFAEFIASLTANHVYNEEVKKENRIEKQIIKEQKRKEAEKEAKKGSWFFDTPASSSNKRRKFRPGFGDWPDEYDYNDVMDDLESEGYAVDE